MCLFSGPKAPEAPKPIIQETAPPEAPELGGEDEANRKRKAKRLGITQLRTDVGGITPGKKTGANIRTIR
jgi:hypothetical protein